MSLAGEAITSPPGERSRDAEGGPGEGLAAACAVPPSRAGAARRLSTSPRRGEVIARAKAMRREMTPPEARLWNVLRAGRLNGWKFSRQVPIGPYIADFAARRERFIVEIDGQSHQQTFARDARRDAWLVDQGYHILRLAAVDVLERIDDVARTITHALATHIARNI